MAGRQTASAMMAAVLQGSKREAPLTQQTVVPERRRFLNWFLGTAAGAFLASVLYPVLRFISPPVIPESTTAEVEAGLTNDPELVARVLEALIRRREPERALALHALLPAAVQRDPAIVALAALAAHRANVEG